MPDNIPNNLMPPEQLEINRINEDDYLKRVRAINEKNLIKLDIVERERIARHIKSLYDDAGVKERQKDLSDDIDTWDDVWRMVRASRPGDDADTPNYRTPLSTVVLEVIHSNIMNVFFSPKDIARVLPTEQGDVSKVNKLDTFINWSMQNEMNIFENIDRLFHSSGKNGECPYIVHWVKEYGTEIIIEPVMNPLDPNEPLLDEITKEVVTQEREEPKLLYNGPRLEVFSRKDYIIPKNATMDTPFEWEQRKIRLTANDIRRGEKEGKYYTNTFSEIGGWGQETYDADNPKIDIEGEEVPLGKTQKVFIEFYGKLRIRTIKKQDFSQDKDEEFEELQDEFIGVMEIVSETLCSLKKNKFPLKERPTGLDEFIPDDEGRQKGTGVMEFMDSIQKSADALHNQYLFGTIQANSPPGFFEPTSNMRDEPIKIRAGFLYPLPSAKSIVFAKIPPPDASLLAMIEKVENMGQVLFGISNFSAGVESTIDPTGPARKAEIVVAQGNVRLNAIIKRKNKTLKNIFRKWYLLYQANMPPNKLMRIAGADRNTPWQFEKINLGDFALKSIPDFELTGNILNANKTLEINKKLAIYREMIGNPFFSPQTVQGMQALHAVTKWLLDGLDEVGISHFLPPVPGDVVQTPEEENARFLQGDVGEPTENEPHQEHIQKHTPMLLDPTVPEEIRKNVVIHIQKHIEMFRALLTRQRVMSQLPQAGGAGGQGAGVAGAQVASPQRNVVPARTVRPTAGMAGVSDRGIGAGI